MVREVAVQIPTVQALRARRQVRAAYVFRLVEGQVSAARDAGLPDSALLALAAISGAAYGARGEKWVSLSPRVIEAFGKGYRWWHRATAMLEQAGFLRCERHAGRLPRYRLVRAAAVGLEGDAA